MALDRCDKSMRCCLTCTYWGGWRQFDGLGTYSYDSNNKLGPCNNVGWKGFSGSLMDGLSQCPDYEPQHK